MAKSSFDWLGFGGKALSAGAQLYAGFSALSSAMDSASLLEEQGALTRDDYERQAALVKEEGHRVRAKQTMEYITAGVEIAGTPQLVLKETMSKSLAKASSLQVTGRNTQRLYNRKAQITQNEGRSQMISSILSAGAEFI